MKKNIFLSFIVLLSGLISSAQTTQPIKWQFTSERIADKVYKIKATANIEKSWFLYGNNPNVADLSPVEIIYADSSIKKGEISFSGKEIERYDSVFQIQNVSTFENQVVIEQTITFSSIIPSIIKASISYNIAKGSSEFIPVSEEKFEVALQGGVQSSNNRILIPTFDVNNPVDKSCGTNQSTEGKGLWAIFFLSFIGGLIALITPCVFPLIPITVSFFTKKADSRKKGISNALLYAFFIFLIYVLLSLPFYFIGGGKAEILNNISTSPVLNLIFFVIFIVFAISFFGYFEITLPGSFASKADSKAAAGNIIGIFFMALTLAIVSFSCTGPILGSLLVGALSKNGGAFQLTVGFAGFGLALALPFALFAMFPNWLKSLPKSGGWLNSVKVVLGFIEVALSIKFFSNADLSLHWGILKREIFITIWILCSFGIVLYLLGIIKFPHDSPLKKLGWVRRTFIIVFAAFGLYLIPGLTNTSWANLKLISGFPPPMFYSIYKQKNNCALGLNCVKDYNEGLALSKKLNKPMLIDFTGWYCTNCRRMEEKVWSEKEVYDIINQDYILVSLYVDDPKSLPADQQFNYKTKSGDTKEIITIGDKWSTFQIENFNITSQPYYLLVSPDEKILTYPMAYNTNVEAYKNWLECGLRAMKK